MGKIVLSNRVAQDQYTDYVRDAFDLSVGDVCTVEIPMNFDLEHMGDWNIIADAQGIEPRSSKPFASIFLLPVYHRQFLTP